MSFEDIMPASVLHWNYRGLTEFPLQELQGEESKITDLYLKENLISKVPNNIGELVHLESLYISGNDITELPKEISKLKCLKCLDVSGNRLKRIPNEIGEVKNLKFLILDENELSELPLRLAELRFLRYLSICDNHLKWLPQKPVYNFHHCELRFWRNPQLKSLPFSLWYHMFRNQQTRSLNIACLNISNTQITKGRRCRLKLSKDSKEWDFDVDFPQQHTNICEQCINNPPSLYELSKRTFYRSLSDVARKKSTECYSVYTYRTHNTENSNVNNLQYDFNNININNKHFVNTNKLRDKEFYVASDIIEEHFDYLPMFTMEDLINGPVSRCENAECKHPVFDYVYYEFTIGQIILIDSVQEVILSCAFCSKRCSDIWKAGVTTLPWSIVED